MMAQEKGSDFKKGKDEGFIPPHNANFSLDAESKTPPYAPGEEDAKFEDTFELLVAPPPPPYVPSCEPSRALTYRPPNLVFEDIYDACKRYVKAHRCYSSRFVKQMTLTEIKNECTFQYTLESFCEKRESCMVMKPYRDGYIDGPENEPLPGPWDIRVYPPGLFRDGTEKTEIPHTAFVKPCDVCVGNGWVRCEKCKGRGRKTCSCCEGSGSADYGGRSSYCIACSGSGSKKCRKCSQTGQLKCEKCNGYKNLKFYRMLIVTWKNFSESFVGNTQNLPSELVRLVDGDVMLVEEEQMLAPIVGAPDESVNEGSRRLIEKHRQAFPNMRIIKQRHLLRSVPLTKVMYKWRDEVGEFYVYGEEKDVYFKNYPQKCCCCTCL